MIARITAPLVTLALVGLTACGTDTASTTTAPTGSDLVVRAQPSITWDKSAYTAASHDGTVVVTLIDDGSVTHNLHIVDDNNKDADPTAKELVVQNSGAEATATFHLAPGTYRVVCFVPGHSNMKAPLTVS
jgi:plastocyanin